MIFNLEQLTAAYPDNFWLDFSAEDIAKATPKNTEYSHEPAAFRALLNQLCINVLVPEIIQEFADSNQSNNSVNSVKFRLKTTKIPTKPKYRLFKSPETLKHISELVTGIKVILQDVEVVIIPTDEIDTDELCVPQEWVDIPTWKGDYYLGVQVNLDDGWLRVWGLTTYQKLKNEGSYDAMDRTYCLDQDELFTSMNVLFLGSQLAPESSPEIAPVETLSSKQIENLINQLTKPKLYSPRLEIPFTKLAALLSDDYQIKQIYNARLGKEIDRQRFTLRRFSELWSSGSNLADIVKNFNTHLIEAMTIDYRELSFRSSGSKLITEQGRMIDLGILLDNHPILLVVKASKESETECKIYVELYPHNEQQKLPAGLSLTVLDDQGKAFVEDSSIKKDSHELRDMIRWTFDGKLGEYFQARISLDGASVTEEFVI